MPDLVEVAALSDCAPASAHVVVVADEVVALFNIDGRVFALDDSCLRCGASIGAGTLGGHYVKCSGCDWRYDVVTGAVDGIPALRIDTFEVRIVDGAVLLERPSCSPISTGMPRDAVSTPRG